jgi:GNAT superfamily N-acetyltransferase
MHMNSEPTLHVEPAQEKDVPLIREFIHDLASYEDHLEYLDVTEARLRQNVFGDSPRAHVLLAYQDSRAVGFAVYYYTFSTFVGLPGLYLEDLFVKPEHRGRGVGHALLAYLAKLAKAQNCFRIEWAVLHWNEPALRFYKKLGAVPMNEWAVYRLSGEPLDRLANEAQA